MGQSRAWFSWGSNSQFHIGGEPFGILNLDLFAEGQGLFFLRNTVLSLVPNWRTSEYVFLGGFPFPPMSLLIYLCSLDRSCSTSDREVPRRFDHFRNLASNCAWSSSLNNTRFMQLQPKELAYKSTLRNVNQTMIA